MAENGIGNGDMYVESVISLLDGGIGVSLSNKETRIRNSHLDRNRKRTRYDIDTESLTSKKYKYQITGKLGGMPRIGVSLSNKETRIRNSHLDRNRKSTRYDIDTESLTSKKYKYQITGKLGGMPRIGEDADVYMNENAPRLNVDDYGGIVGYTSQQENGDILEKNVKDAKFRKEVVNNRIFEQGASFINPSSFELYSVDGDNLLEGDSEVVGSNLSTYATSSINVTASTDYVKGSYKYNGGNEDLTDYVLGKKTDVDTHHLMYNEEGVGNTVPNLTPTGGGSEVNAVSSLYEDGYEFIEDDSYPTSSMLFGHYEGAVKPKTLVMKTNELFRYGKIGSIVARFKTGSDFGATKWPSSKTKMYGMSRGRNLLTEAAYKGGEVGKFNGYDNPYCRVWTNHTQYSKHSNLIRPIGDKKGIKLGGLRPTLDNKGNDTNKILKDYSVLEDNGHVKISPYNDGKRNDIKKYMFSIENLAWVGHTDELTDEQKGPNGGRIMWFPPYGLTFSEQANVAWNSHSFIGRGEKINTYTDTERSLNLSFSILVDHPSSIDVFTSENNNYDIESNEQKLLRYFAGCDNLQIDSVCKDDDDKNAKINDNGGGVEIVEIPESFELIFYVLYPNNFTGANYDDNNNTYTYPYGGNTISEKHYKNTTLKNAYSYIASKYENTGLTYNDETVNIGVYHHIGKGKEKNANDYRQTCKKQEEIKCFYKEDETRLNEKNGNPFDCLTLGLNTELFSDYINKVITSDNDSADKKLNDIVTEACKVVSDEKEKSSIERRIRTSYIKLTELLTIFVGTKVGVVQRFVSLGELYDGNNFKNIDSLFSLINKKNDEYEVTKVTKFGKASDSGKKNDSLSSFRALTLFNFLKECGYIDDNVELNDDDRTDVVVKEDQNDGRNEGYGKVNAPTQKTGRLAALKVLFTKKNPDSDETNVKENSNSTSNLNLSTVTCNDNAEHSYDNEYLYFSKIKKDDPLIYKRLTEKFKHFDPAFHSITPEGFNARLTFLHQCTRQGPTTSSSDVGMTSSIGAGNLAFGAPPYIILRIGDFYNTKAIISNVNFQYDERGLSWDLNPEGIGVQPMYAKVTLQLKLVGGSDIQAPISRLQNAISSNFYANASIYDKVALHDANEQIEDKKAKREIMSTMYGERNNDKL